MYEVIYINDKTEQLYSFRFFTYLEAVKWVLNSFMDWQANAPIQLTKAEIIERLNKTNGIRLAYKYWCIEKMA